MEASIINNDGQLQVSGPQPKTRILLVDDERSILNSLSQLLSRSYNEYLIGTTESAEEAIRIVKTTKVDVVVTDFKLPGMTGLELAEAIKEVSPRTKSILITAYGTDSVVHRAQECGCLAYLEKPLDLSLLCQYIDKAVDSRRAFTFAGHQLALPDIVQFYAMRKESVVLRACAGNKLGTIAIDKGVIVHATYGKLQGVEALLSLLSAEGATLGPIHCAPPNKKTLAVTWFALSAASEVSSKEERLRLLGSDHSDVVIKDTSAEESKSNSEDHSIAELVARFKLKRGATDLPEPRAVAADSTALVQKAPANEGIRQTPEDDLTLMPEDSDIDPNDDSDFRRKKRIRALVNEGIKHFRAHRLDKAEHAWLAALKLDERCVAATENLKLLQKLLALEQTKH